MLDTHNKEMLVHTDIVTDGNTGVDPGRDRGTGSPKYRIKGTLATMSPKKFLPVVCKCAHIK